MSALSTKQLRILGIEATRAFDLAAKHDALELPGEVATCSKSAQRDFWRQRVCAEVTGFCSFKELNQTHYRPLLSRFQSLAGNTGAAFKTQLREERGAAATTPAGAGLVRDLWHHAAKAGLSEAYVAAIVKGKTRGQTSDLADLSMRLLQQVHDTVLLRARQKLGRSASVLADHSPVSGGAQAAGKPGELETRAPSKSRTYVLKPRRTHSTATQPINPDNEPY